MRNNQVLMPFKEAGHSHQHCLDAALETAEQTCIARGVRLTRLRRRVLELVWNSHEPIKAYYILDQLSKEHSGSAPPTVYRALDFLQAQGMVHKIESLNSYIGCGSPGHSQISQFLICSKCGSVAEMDDRDVRRLLADRAATLGFHIDQEIIEIKGLCSSCSAQKQ